MNNILVVIPAYNPEKSLLSYINELLAEGFNKIIVVDDGSRKECADIFDAVLSIKECILLRHEHNKGKGAALKTAFKHFLESKEFNSYKGVVTADADGQHSSHDTSAVAAAISNGDNNFVLGVRDFDSENVPFKSKKGNKITRTVMHILFSKRITDTQTGLRGLNRRFIKDCLSLKGDRFEYEINMLILGTRIQNIVEIPIETIYFNQNRATSFKAVKDSLRIYSCIFSSFFKFCFSSISSSIVDIVLFTIVSALFHPSFSSAKSIFISTVIARIFSSIYNYIINKNLVFGKSRSRKSALKYFSLVVFIMTLSAALVTGIYYLTQFNKSLIKIGVDIVLFILSFKLQQTWVFN